MQTLEFLLDFGEEHPQSAHVRRVGLHETVNVLWLADAIALAAASSCMIKIYLRHEKARVTAGKDITTPGSWKSKRLEIGDERCPTRREKKD